MPEIVTSFPRAVRAIESLLVPMPDGTRLAARVWMPEDAERCPVPAIIEYLPYRKRDGTRIRDEASHPYLAGHGYACIRLDIRGTGDSEGLIDDEYTRQEHEDGVAAIAWIAAQPWCTGRVGMIGISWGGFNGLQIAALRPPALKAIVSVGSTDDRYATDIHWVGGCLSKDNFDWSATMFAYNDLPPDPEIVGEAWRDMWMARVRHNTPWILEWMRHQRRDAYWKHGSVCEDFARIEAPVYAVSGWADNYSEAVPRLLAGLTCPRKGLIGPWAHTFPHRATVEPSIGWLQEVLRWFDHWLKDADTGIMDEPMLRVWMQDSLPPRTCYAERPGRWVAEEVWPSPRMEGREFALGADGSLGRAGAPWGTLSVCSPLWVGIAAGEVGRYGGDAEWATDQREDDGGSLVFVTEPLPERLEILGAPQLNLTFTSDKPQALVAVRLNDVAPDGASTRVSVGLLNLTHRDSHEHPSPLEPGRIYRACVDLDDIAHAFPAGHRIAVSLSTTYWPIAWPSPELATLGVVAGETRLVLPVRPPRQADAELRPFDPPLASQPAPTVSTPLARPHRRSVHRDLLTGLITVEFPRGSQRVEHSSIARAKTSDCLARYTIVDGDPLSARIDTDFMTELERPDTTITHRSRGSMTCDRDAFHIHMMLQVLEQGKVVFEREWRQSIPRDLL